MQSFVTIYKTFSLGTEERKSSTAILYTCQIRRWNTEEDGAKESKNRSYYLHSLKDIGLGGAWSMELKFHGVAAAVSQLRSVCRMLQVIYNEIFKGNMTKKLDAYNLLKIDPTKVH
ncbi:hypothetical protein Bca4012_078089 [Brassica carinata]